ncbi:MAG: hypothetical protein GY773_29575, partial [Actinomycetia bacterium]|nr:hypothetical protein [Actinomycetes bacterium]
MPDAGRGATVPDGGDELAPVAAPFDADVFGGIYRREAGRCLTTLVRVLGDVDLAEDALSEAFVIVARRWPADGVPPNPGGSITTTARNRGTDHQRRQSPRSWREAEAGGLADDTPIR